MAEDESILDKNLRHRLGGHPSLPRDHFPRSYTASMQGNMGLSKNSYPKGQVRDVGNKHLHRFKHRLDETHGILPPIQL